MTVLGPDAEGACLEFARRSRLWIGCVVLSIACTQDRVANGREAFPEVRHPLTEYMVATEQLVRVVNLSRPDKIPEPFGVIERQLLAAASKPPSGFIGGGRDASNHSFGAVSVAAVDQRGTVFTIDNRLNAVSAFNRSGAFQYQLGRSGRGAGEYSDPRAISVSPTGDVFVGEVGRRLHVFKPRQAGHPTVRTFDADVAIQDMCFLGKTLFVHARPQEKNDLLYEVDSLGKVRKSFGELYRSPNRILNIEIARGAISCAVKEGVILYSPTAAVAELRAYGAEGTLRWVSAIRGYRSIEMLQPAGKPQNSRIRVPDGGAHRLERVVYHPDGFFVLQFSLVTMQSIRDGKGYVGLTTLIVSALDGSGVSIGDNLPLIAAIDNDVVWFVRNDSPPSLAAHRLDD